MVRLGEPLTKDELDEMIKDADINRNGKINYKGDNFEFQNSCCTLMESAYILNENITVHHFIMAAS